MLAQHEPFPAVVMDRGWNVVRGNLGAQRLFGHLLAPDELPADANVLRLMIEPGPVRDHVVNWSDVVPALLERATREAVERVLDGTTAALVAELQARRDVGEVLARERTSPPAPVIDVVFDIDGVEIAFFSVVSTVGTPLDVTAQEVRVESFFPSDPEAEARWRSANSASTVSPASGPDLAASWRRRPGYLDTATYGLPPRQTVEHSHRVIDEWDEGRVLYDSWNDAADEARRLFASFVGVTADAVAVGSATSTLPASSRSSLPDTADVVVPARRVHLAAVPVPRPGRARRRGARSSARGIGRLGGRRTRPSWRGARCSRPTDASPTRKRCSRRRDRVGALTVVDATQATGWLPLPLDRVDVAVCSAYKWLCCPRGTAFMVASPRVLADLPSARGQLVRR